nr:n-acetylglucosamine-induced protein 1 [Quercus suber]
MATSGEASASSLPHNSSPGCRNSTLEFWNVNVPASQHTAECPSYLRYALSNAKDRAILSTPDSAYQRQSWADVRAFVQDRRLDLFQRVPSDLRRYRQYCARLEAEHGSIMAFVMHVRLQWRDLTPRGTRFFEHHGTDDADYRILLNDWPYGLDPRIRHLVVWTKFVIPEEPGSEALTAEAQAAVEAFVEREFARACGREKVLWFKNWSSLKSIHAVEHFHVLLFDPPEGFVDRITGGDVALADKVANAEIEVFD